MKTLKFDIPLYNIHVDLVQVETKDDKDDVIKLMRAIECEQEFIDKFIDYIERGYYDIGNTYCNFDFKRILVIFYPMSNEETRAETYAYEKRHIEDRVMQFASVDDIESAGLLAGYLGRMFYQFNNIVNKK